ncbi:MAG TPA: DedA family protein [Terriglobia bacterium]|nr:DedA family protein [Terriglobia bacterium]
MVELLHLLSRYGYTLVFANLFVEAIGIPIPSTPILLTAGAACAYGTMNVPHLLLSAVLASILGQYLLFLVGRYTGWALLGFLCRLSINPESCILKSAQSFYRRGRMTLIFSKYLPGINIMAAPLAGSLNMSPIQFLGLEFLASCLYVLPIMAFGFYFSHLISFVVDWFVSLSHSLMILVLLAILGALVYRLWHSWKDRSLVEVPRVTPIQLAQTLASHKDGVIIADTRSHGYYDRGATRIKGSVRLEPNQLLEEASKFPGGKKIYLYCT